MDVIDHVEKWGTWFIGIIGAVGITISHLRRNKSETDTDVAVGAAQQASARVYVEQLLETRKLLVDERAAWAIERAELHAQLKRQHEQHEAEREDWRVSNREIGERFEQALEQFRTTQAASDVERGNLIERLAEAQGRAEGLQYEKIDLMAAIQRKAGEEAESKRALLAGKEREIATLMTQIEGLKDRNHDLVNQLYGDGTATGILGPKE